jgi:hypothetical protein
MAPVTNHSKGEERDYLVSIGMDALSDKAILGKTVLGEMECKREIKKARRERFVMAALWLVFVVAVSLRFGVL